MQLKAAVIGHPIAHSKSPALHRAAYELLGADISYQLVDLAPGKLAEFVNLVRAEGDWAGVSVTMPHKAAMLALVDETDRNVRSLGVLNTVVVDQPSGRLRAMNTDVAGIVHALAQAGLRQLHRGSILGGGGTALAALAALKQLGALAATVYLRDKTKSAELNAFAASAGLTLEVRSFDELVDGFEPAELLISTLPPKAADSLVPLLVDAAPMLLDVAYDPWPSSLAQAYTQRGGVVVSGLEMLMYQAMEQVAAFTGQDLRGRVDVINVMCDSIGLPRR